MEKLRNISRRNFLHLGWQLPALYLLSGIDPSATQQVLANYSTLLADQQLAWGKADTGAKDFAQRLNTGNNGDGGRIGASFSPEYVMDLFQYQSKRKVNRYQEPLAVLKIMVEDLGIKDIRLGMQWANNMDAQGNITGYYDPFIEYLLAQGVNLTLDRGPINSQRSPEQHVGLSTLLSLPRIPKYNETIAKGSPLANAAVQYIERFDDDLFEKFGEKLTGDSDQHSGGQLIIQNENESMDRLGKFGWGKSFDYLEQLARLTVQRYPNSPILMNCWGTFEAGKVLDFFEYFKNRNPKDNPQFILGLDYYYQFATSLIEFAYRHPFNELKQFDLFGLAQMTRGMGYNEGIKERADQLGVHIVTTELQQEPWWNVADPSDHPEQVFLMPGKSARGLRYALLRSSTMHGILSPVNVHGGWGIDWLAKVAFEGKLSAGQKEIVDQVQAINTFSSAA